MTSSADSATTNPKRSSSRGNFGDPSLSRGVRGWLLALCLMLTVVAPIVSFWVVGREFDALAAHFVTSRGARWWTIASIALTTCSVLFGIYAGVLLWTIKPQAVRVTRAALSFGLAVDVCTTTISTTMSAASLADGLFYTVLQNLAPSLLFFTGCLAYLNRSKRVEATYGSE